MLTKEEKDILNRLSADDIKKYRPDIFSEEDEELSCKANNLSENEAEQNIDAKAAPGCLFLLIVFGIEVAALMAVLLINHKLLTYGRIYHYCFLLWVSLWVWSCLPEGKLTKKGQIIVFTVIPLVEFMLVQVLGISNWWGMLFVIVYPVVIAQIFDIDLNDGGSSSGSTGKYTNKFIGSAIKGTINGMSGSRRKR